MRRLHNQRSHVGRTHRVRDSGRAVAHGAGRPVLAAVVAQRWVYQFQRLAEAIVVGEPCPPTLADKAQAPLAHGPIAVIRVGHGIQLSAGRILKPDGIAGVAQHGVEVGEEAAIDVGDGEGEPASHHIGHGRILRAKRRRVRRDHKIAARSDERVGWERVVDAARDGPAGQVHVGSGGVEQLDVFLPRIFRRGMIHDLVDHHALPSRHQSGSE